MTPELRSALAEFSFAAAEVQSAAARYEQEHNIAAAEQIARRMDRVVTQVPIVKGALRADVKLPPALPVEVSREMVGRVLVEFQDADDLKVMRMLQLGLGLAQPVVSA